MSVTEAIGRIAQIQALIAQAAPAVATSGTATTTGAAGGADFARTLTAASAGRSGTITAMSRPSADATVPADLEPLIRAAAERAGVDPALVAAVAKAESGFRADAGSPAGARGLMQLMPSTAAGLGVTDILDPAQNLDAGARYLRAQLDRFGGDVRLALAAYNAGPGAVTRYGGVPPYQETQTYVTRVMDNYTAFRGAFATAA